MARTVLRTTVHGGVEEANPSSRKEYSGKMERLKPPQEGQSSSVQLTGEGMRERGCLPASWQQGGEEMEHSDG